MTTEREIKEGEQKRHDDDDERSTAEKNIYTSEVAVFSSARLSFGGLKKP